jgi:hypothetical protein
MLPGLDDLARRMNMGKTLFAQLLEYDFDLRNVRYDIHKPYIVAC